MAVATGSRRIVSALIADVVNSTGIAETLGAERAGFLMAEVTRIMTEQVGRYEGTVVQKSGDEIFAVFGAPLAHEDDSERAVRAGLAIQRALAVYAQEVESAYGVRLSARVGVNTGPVVIPAPSEDGDIRDTWNGLGDTVNVAARLQELVEPGHVAISLTTARQVEHCFDLEELGERDLQGKTAPVTTFRVKGPREVDHARAEGPLVGREFELTVLERAMDGLRDGRGVIVSVMGEAGIGKTRLVSEVRERYSSEIRFIEGRAVSYAQSFPYWPIRDLLREWLGVGASTPETRVRLDLKAQVAQLWGAQSEDAYPFLASLLGLTLEPEAAERIRELNRESIQHETFQVFAEFLCKLAEELPLCVVLEDLHWADESTLELLEDVLRVTEEAGVGLLFLYRSERELRSWHLGERARQRFPHRYREIELRPLPSDASRTLVVATAEGELPESVAELLVERAGGNPFFLEEAFHDLVERGALSRENGSWELAVKAEELAVPAVVQGALQARLDRLDRTTREVVSVAAVIGRTFGLQLLTRVLPEDDLLPALSDLQRLDLIVETRRRPSPEYRFRHGLVQEVAYSSLVEATRKRLHKQVGEALEGLYVDSDDEVYDLLARHFSEADEPEKAIEYLLKAGDAARALYADQEAIEHYKQARNFLARLGDDRRTRDTLFKMALAYHLAFEFEKAEDVYDEAFCCRVDEPRVVKPSERIETAETRPEALVPGDVYSTEGAYFTEHLFRGLLEVDADLNVIPAMADNMRVSSDGLEYLFRLRENARWSDGEPLTAEDFAFAWRSMREEETRTAFMMEDIEAAEALDDRTLEVRLRAPRSYFPYVLTSVWSFPWPRHKCEELGENWRKPENLVGNGPFMLAEYDQEHALLIANPHWRGPRGNVRELHVTFRGGPDAALVEEWRNGRYDVLHLYNPSVRDAPETIAEPVSELATTYVGFNAGKPPFANELVRKAFSYGLDRARVKEAIASFARAATKGGAIPPAMPGHSHRVAPPYDVELAKKMLADAGYPDGRGLPELELLLPQWLRSPEVIVDQWAELGARVNVKHVKFHDDLGRLATADMWLASWTTDYPDPDGFFRGLIAREVWPFYRDEELLDRIEEARALTDQNERLRLYHEIDRLWVTDHAALLPLWYRRSLTVRRPWVHGLWTNPLSKAHIDAVTVRREGT